MKVGTRVKVICSCYQDGAWTLLEQEGIIYKDFNTAYCEDLTVTQNLYGIRFDDKTEGSFWTKQIEVLY